MRNFGLILLLVVGLLAGRTIPVRHSHDDCVEPHDHDALAHVHLRDHSLAYGHPHHGDHDSDHDHSTAANAPHHDHDDDAVYVGDFVAVFSDGSVEVKVSCLGLDAWANVVSGVSASQTPPDAVALPPPRLRPDGIALYLRTLSLRI